MTDDAFMSFLARCTIAFLTLLAVVQMAVIMLIPIG
jgi:hypothetical protein